MTKAGKGKGKANFHQAIRPSISHAFRSLEERDGLVRKHSNPDIDPTKVTNNIVRMADGKGGWREPTKDDTVDSIVERIESEFAEAKRSYRKRDGTIGYRGPGKNEPQAVEVIFQLDPAFTGKCEDLTDEKLGEIQRLSEVALGHLSDHVGNENFIGYAMHLDETHPHVQAFYIPKNEDGKYVGMKSFGHGENGLYYETHNQVRQVLRDAGYDATNERVDKLKKHLPLEDFKKYKSLMQQLDERELGVKEREALLDEREALLSKGREELNKKLAGVNERETAVGERETSVSSRETAIGEAEDDLRVSLTNVKQREAAARRRENDLKLREERAERIIERDRDRKDDADEYSCRTRQRADKYLDEALRKEIDVDKREQAIKQREMDAGARQNEAQEVLDKRDEILASAHEQVSSAVEAAAQKARDAFTIDDSNGHVKHITDKTLRTEYKIDPKEFWGAFKKHHELEMNSRWRKYSKDKQAQLAARDKTETVAQRRERVSGEMDRFRSHYGARSRETSRENDRGLEF